tara:strand:- start:1253 stop:1402 length:150 start_codon:yes stop_codon:yes gene_type:complete
MKKRDVENNPYHFYGDALLKKCSYTYTFEKSIAKITFEKSIAKITFSNV